jgi:hypothetical protein
VNDAGVPFVSGNRVRLIRPAPLGHAPGPSIGAVGTVMGLEIPAGRSQPSIWRVQFDEFTGQFNATCRPGHWFVDSDEIELQTSWQGMPM